MSHRRTRVVSVGVGVVLLLSCACAIVAATLRETEPDPDSHTAPPKTVAAVRADLVQENTVTGSLAFAGNRQLASSIAGVLTWAPSPRTVLSSGDEMYRIDNRAVYLFKGRTPAWRKFKEGMSDGPDVRQLESALADLGYYSYWVDDHFDENTAKAIEDWQAATGQPETGTIAVGRIQFHRGDIRVVDKATNLGAPVSVGAPVLDVSASRQTVTTKVELSQQSTATKDAKVDITLPDGRTVKGRVSRVGTAVEGTDENGVKQTMIPVTIVLTKRSVVKGVPTADVDITFDDTVKKNVLQVPVESLIAVAGGGYAVQVVADGETTDVPVELGTFLDGMVEIKKGDVRRGDELVVPSI